jgi:hypothetical protein
MCYFCVYLLNLIKNPSLIVVDRVVLDSFLRKMLLESVHNFDLLEHNVDSARSAAWNVINFVCLNSDLDIFDSCDERKHEVPPWLLIAI